MSEAMTKPFLLALEDASLWLLTREGPKLAGHQVTLAQLRERHPRLLAELTRTNNADCPRVIVERPR